MKEPWLSILMPSMVLGSLFAVAIFLRLLARDLTRRTGVRFNSRFALLTGYRVVWLGIIAYSGAALALPAGQARHVTGLGRGDDGG